MKKIFGIKVYLEEYYYGEYQGEDLYQISIFQPTLRKFISGGDEEELAEKIKANKTSLPMGIKIEKGKIEFNAHAYEPKDCTESGDLSFSFFVVEFENLEELKEKLIKDNCKNITGYQFLKGTGLKNEDLEWEEVLRRGRENGINPLEIIEFMKGGK